ncbi:hypothetical protein [Novosphingobium sp. SG720]|uniref:hypothetical protein n=1 Tax=Novosphingobium sp. SG720 TaxID=2586998 RepID=UPI001446008F|nr:hypothetical protein [Novosphingobium sp. SG720]NKJ44852.1 hypothetical protein [Novosphingobium sp. SG720]
MMAIAPYGYAYEKLLGAMEIMATGKGTRPERLARAGKQYLLPIRSPKMHKLPDDLAAALDSLYRELTSVPPPTQWDNSFDATAQRMSWQKAERLAGQLFSLFLAVAELRRQA